MIRFCATHWEALRAAIRARELWHLVSNSGEEVARRVTEHQANPSELNSFDPLMGAHNMIVGVAMNVGAVQPSATEVCPVCALAGFNWIDEAANGVKAHVDRISGGRA